LLGFVASSDSAAPGDRRPINAAEDRVRQPSVSRVCPAARPDGAALERGRPRCGQIGLEDADVGGSLGGDCGTDRRPLSLSLSSVRVGT
jgi:hypothetical protein